MDKTIFHAVRIMYRQTQLVNGFSNKPQPPCCLIEADTLGNLEKHRIAPVAS